MIIKASQRSGGTQLGLHLLKTENEQVEIHEVSGFVSETVMGAMKEAQAMALGTRCKQYLFSVSLNPPETEAVRVEVFEGAIAKIEERLGLEGQPRVVVFHEKEGRRHAHVVWSRIDAETMTAKQLSFYKAKLQEVSRELFLDNGWKMPRGLMAHGERDPRNFTLAEWQQAKRAGLNPHDLKGMVQDCWAVSDNRESFARALEERGLYLAKGDRRGYGQRQGAGLRSAQSRPYEGLLRAIIPTEEMFNALMLLFKKRWSESESRTKDERTSLKLQIAAAEKKIGQLLERIVETSNESVISAYERKVEDLEREKLVLVEKTARCGTALGSFDATFRTAFDFLANPWIIWESGGLAEKRTVLNLTLASHLVWDWNQGVRTAELSLPIKALQDENEAKVIMAETEGIEQARKTWDNSMKSGESWDFSPVLAGASEGKVIVLPAMNYHNPCLLLLRAASPAARKPQRTGVHISTLPISRLRTEPRNVTLNVGSRHSAS